MTTKILNLDQLAEREPNERRVIAINGVEHPIVEMTVGMFIDVNARAKKLEGETDMVKQLEATIDTILLFVPTLKREQLTNHKLETLQTIVEFVRGDDIEQAQAQASMPEGAAAPEGEPGN